MRKVDEVLKLFKSSSYEDRMEAIQKSYDYLDNVAIREAITHCLSDEDELVRIDAIEAAGDFKLAVDDSQLEALFNDQDLLVRCAALITCGQLKKHTLTSKVEVFCNSPKEREQLSAFFSLYLMSHEVSYLEQALNFINSEDYQIRCSIINLAHSFLEDKKAIKYALTLFKEKMFHEGAEAVLSSWCSFSDEFQ